MEEQIQKYKGIHPGVVIEQEYIKRNMSQRELAAKIGVHFQTLNAVINGRRKLTLELAYKLEKEFGCEEGFLAVLQTLYDYSEYKRRIEMNNIQVLEIRYESGGRTGMIHPVIIRDRDNLILVDAGLVGQRDILEEAVERIGISFSQLTHIFITHHDHDHIGSLRVIKEKYPYIKIVSSEVESPFIDKSEKSPRLIQAESIYPTLPEELKEGALKFQQFLESIESVAVDIKVNEGGVLEFLPDVEVIMTPGHTPGHASLYHKPTKTIIAGDAVVFENGHLDVANPRYTLDMRSALESIRKLAGYDARRIICYHGGVFEGDCNKELLRVFDKYRNFVQ